MRLTAYGWLLWIGGLIAVFAVDYSIRVIQRDLHFGGVPEPVQLVFAALLGVAALRLLFLGTNSLKLSLRLILIAVQGFVGFWVAAFMGLYYVCSAGIDCL
jgi:hypothetical protein